MSKKYAFIINVFRETDFHSGGERVFYEIVNKAAENGCIVDLYCTCYLGNSDVLRSKINGIFFLGHPKDFKSPDKIEKFYSEINNIIQTEDHAKNYDFIISENISPSLGFAKNEIKILQGHSLLHYMKFCKNPLSKFFFMITKFKFIMAQKKWLNQPCGKIVVPSATLKNELIKNFQIPEESFSIIPPGVDAPKLPPSFELNDNEVVFGLSAPSFTKKGGEIFLKALYVLKQNVKQKGLKFRAKIIYPKHSNNFELKFLIFRYGLGKHIEFLPYQKDMSGFYESIDVLIMPSYMETFGLVALEAMIFGKPAVVSSYCGVSEVIKDAQNGFIFNMSGNYAKNLAEKMLFILENPNKYKAIAQKAYLEAKNYSWKSFCNNFYIDLQR